MREIYTPPGDTTQEKPTVCLGRFRKANIPCSRSAVDICWSWLKMPVPRARGLSITVPIVEQKTTIDRRNLGTLELLDMECSPKSGALLQVRVQWSQFSNVNPKFGLP
jgi:hypothetical protein